MYKQIPEDVIEESEGENRPDRPDLAAMQNYFSIMDPELKAVPVERLIMAWDETNLIKNRIQKQALAPERAFHLLRPRREDQPQQNDHDKRNK